MSDERDRAAPGDDEETGAAIGRESEPERPPSSELARPTDPGVLPVDEPADLPPDQPDEGWQDWPAGHRQGRPADDDLQRRKG